MLSVMVDGPESSTRSAILDLLADRQDVRLVDDEEDARLILYCGPIADSPYSGCNERVRIIQPSESTQAARLTVLGAVRTNVHDGTDTDASEDDEPRRTYAEFAESEGVRETAERRHGDGSEVVTDEE